MKELSDCKEIIHSCSKCGLCQSVCPIYKITGNDCTVSRGQFIMLGGVLKGDLKMSKKLNHYMDLCLKCNACSKFCPSGIDVVEIIALAKAEYFKKHAFEKVFSFLQKSLIFGFGLNLLSIFARNIKSKKFDKKVVYFGGCGSKVFGNKSVVNILNSCGIEVITPSFDCCGIPYYVRGDMNNYEKSMRNFIAKLEKTGCKEIVTTCASCEKTLKSYIKNFNVDFSVKNIFEYIREAELKLSLKKEKTVTFHKPCNIPDFDNIEWILNNTGKLNYIEAEDFDLCCGLNGITKPSNFKIMLNLFKNKRNKFIKTGAKTVLTSCLGCETALKLYSLGKYSVEDFTEFLDKNCIIQDSALQ